MLNRLAELIRPRPLIEEVLRASPAGATDLSQLPVGTELQARVTASLPNRIYQVLIGDRAYTVHLPVDARPGDELQLTVVERDPQRAPAPAVPHAPAAGGAAVTTLSPTARFITALLSSQPQLPLPGTTQTSTPLLPGPPGDSAAVAARLGQALAASGMFYESHQAQWVAGERSLAQLMQEPQARIAPLPHADAQEPAARPVNAAPVFAAEPAPAPVAEESVHPALLAVVKEQLQTLSTLQLAWHGPVWPGQEMLWEIAEQATQRGSSPEESGTWQTRLSLRLPRLGDVRATLSLGPKGVVIALAAADGSTADAMSAGSSSLRSALAAAGLRPASLTVQKGGRE